MRSSGLSNIRLLWRPMTSWTTMYVSSPRENVRRRTRSKRGCSTACSRVRQSRSQFAARRRSSLSSGPGPHSKNRSSAPSGSSSSVSWYESTLATSWLARNKAEAALTLSQATSYWHQADEQVMADAAFIPLQTQLVRLFRSMRVHNAIYSTFSSTYDITQVWLSQ